jgi:hypothetical protein
MLRVGVCTQAGIVIQVNPKRVSDLWKAIPKSCSDVVLYRVWQAIQLKACDV